MSIQLTGLNELRVKLEKNCNLDQVKQVVKMNGAELQEQAQRNAPVGTPASTGIPGYAGGTLKRSIKLDLADGGMTAKVEAEAEYAPYVEFGTRFMEARPYMKNAYNAQKLQFKNDLDRLMN